MIASKQRALFALAQNFCLISTSRIADGIKDFQTAQQLGSKLFKLIHKYLRKYLLRIWISPNKNHKKAEIYSLLRNVITNLCSRIKGARQLTAQVPLLCKFHSLSLSLECSLSVRDKILSLLFSLIIAAADGRNQKKRIKSLPKSS